LSSSSSDYSDWSAEAGAALRIREHRRPGDAVSYIETSSKSSFRAYSSDESEAAEPRQEVKGRSVERIVGSEQNPSSPAIYYVKFKGQTYVHCC
jgi:hypothetical protein